MHRGVQRHHGGYDGTAKMSGNMATMPTTPYRTQVYEDVPAIMTAQMVGTCRLLKEWEKFKPVVAGGALWSWASGEAANDVDIFVKKGWRTKRKADQLYGVDQPRKLQGKVKCSSYGGSVTEDGPVPVMQYKTILPGDTRTPVDFCLTPWKGAAVTRHFDYLHDTVAFGRGISCTNGATYYMNSMFTAAYDGHRNEEVVKEKIKVVLWGKPEAADRLRRVMVVLTHIYEGIVL